MDAFNLPLREFFGRYSQAVELENWKSGGDSEIAQALKALKKNVNPRK